LEFAERTYFVVNEEVFGEVGLAEFELHVDCLLWLLGLKKRR